MELLISFRHTLYSLSDQEYFQCITQFVQQCPRDCVSSMIFLQLHREIHSSKLSNLNEINTIITDIIALRKINDTIDITSHYTDDDDDKEQHKPKTLTLEHLPYVLLYEIAGYLTFAQHVKFEKTNRTLFIASRYYKSPRYALDCTRFSNLVNHITYTHPFYKTKRFKALETTVEELKKIQPNEHKQLTTIFERIDELKLCCHVLGNISHLENGNTLCNINTLRMYNVMSFVESTVFRIASLAHNLKYCEIQSFKFKIDGLKCEWIKQLKGMAMFCDDVGSVIGNDLESLHYKHQNIVKKVNGTFNHLEELCIDGYLGYNEIALLLEQNMRCLKRINISDAACFQSGKAIPLLNKWMTRAEYLCLTMSDRCSSNKEIFGILTNALEGNQSNRLKLRIKDMVLRVADEFNIAKFVQELMNGLCLYYANWMIIFPDLCIENPTGECILLERFLESVKAKCCVKWIKIPGDIDHIAVYRFVISNHECTMNGYHESWIMKCPRCKQPPVFEGEKQCFDYDCDDFPFD